MSIVPARPLPGPRQAIPFLLAAIRYWSQVYPLTTIEVARWRRLARSILDDADRDVVFAAVGKRSNLDGAAAFAVFAPWPRRRLLVRTLVAFQLAYNYADLLAERSDGDRPEEARQLHEPLCRVFEERSASRFGRRAFGPGGYLQALSAAASAAFWRLPSAALVAETAARRAGLIVEFQALSVSSSAALMEGGAGAGGLPWWEQAAAGGSSLSVLALMALAARKDVDAAEARAVSAAYGGHLGALHSLLDSLVDEDEDEANSQLSLIGCYPSPSSAASGMASLALESLRAVERLPRARDHRMLFAAMCASYLIEPAAAAPRAAGVADAVGGVLGDDLTLPLKILALHRRITRRRRSAPVPGGECAARVQRGETDARVA